MSQPQTYHVYFDEEIHGPFLLEQIESLWARGVIPRNATYFAADDSPWLPVADLIAANVPADLPAVAQAAQVDPSATAPSRPVLFWLAFAVVLCAAILAAVLYGTAESPLENRMTYFNTVKHPAPSAPPFTVKKADDTLVSLDTDYTDARAAEMKADYRAMSEHAKCVAEKYPHSALACKCLADACYYTGAMPEALAAIRKAIGIKPDDYMAWHDLGGIQLRLNHLLDAEAAYARAMKLAPGEAMPLVDMAEVRMQNKQADEALQLIQQAEQILRTQPFNSHHGELLEAWVWDGIGAGYLEQQMPENALGAFKRAAELAPGSAEIRIQLGDVQIDLQHYGEAVESLETATKLSPNNARAWYKLGRGYDEMFRFDDAITAYTRALAIQHDYPAARDALDRGLARGARAKASPSPAASATPEPAKPMPPPIPNTGSDSFIARDDDYKALRAAEAEGNYPAMLESAKKLTAKFPNSPLVFKYLGAACCRTDALPEALAALNRAIQLRPDDPVAWHYLAVTRMKLGQYPEAEAACKSGLEFAPAEPALLLDMAALMRQKRQNVEAARLTRQAEQSLRTGPFDDRHGGVPRSQLWNDIGDSYTALRLPQNAITAYKQNAASDTGLNSAFEAIAAAQLALQHYDEAAAAYKSATERSPNDPASWTGLGRACLHLHRVPEAAEAFARAAKLDEGNAIPLVWLGRAQLDGGHYEQAAATYERATMLASDNSRTWNGLGWSYLHLHRHADAIAAFQRAASVNPKYADTWVGLGNAFETAGQVEDALGAFRKAVETNAASPEAWARLGLAYDKARRTGDAIAAYGKALEIKPGDPFIQAGFDRDVAQVAQSQGNAAIGAIVANAFPKPGDAVFDGREPEFMIADETEKKAGDATGANDEDYMAAKLAGTKGDYPAMLEFAKKFAKTYPRSESACKCLARALYHTGALQEALAAAKKALKIKPDDMVAWHIIGNIHLKLGQLPEAEAACKQAMKLAPDEPMPLLDMAGVAMGNKQNFEALRLVQQAEQLLKTKPFNSHNGEIREDAVWDAIAAGYVAQRMPRNAAGAFEQAVALNADSADMWARFGEVQMDLKRYDGAARSLENATRLSPGTARPWYALGRAYAGLRRPDDAMRAFEQAVESAPDNALFLIWLANSYVQAARYDEAAPLLERAVKADPGDAFAWRDLGGAYFLLQRNGEAIDAFQRAAKITPKDAGTWFALGRACDADGKTEDAITAFQTATQCDPGYQQAWLGLGIAYDKADKTAEAIAAYRKALAIKPDDKEANAALKRDLAKPKRKDASPSPTASKAPAPSPVKPREEKDDKPAPSPFKTPAGPPGFAQEENAN